jgi:hypothetical protein
MGKKTFLLLPVENDWRWFKKIEHTPWYPSIRLYRQQTKGDWATVLDRVRSHLVALPTISLDTQ